MNPRPTPTARVGTRIGPYEIVGWLGAGGMGDVYRARDVRLGRDVAVKVLPDAFAADPDRLARFEREARMLAALNHPHIAAIYGVEESGGLRALVLELVPGPTLAEAIGTGLPPARALALAIQIADALAAAHAQAIVHRDLKPANVQLAPGDIVKVLDFGVAKMWRAEAGAAAAEAVTATGTQTVAGRLVGTAAYMSPEQARGLSVDRRTDVWAFGCVLFEMLGGRPAFAGQTLSDTIAAVLERDPDWRTLPASTPPPVRALIRRCLAKDAAARPGDMTEVRRGLEACLAASSSRSRVTALRLSIVVAVGAAAALVAYSFWSTPRPPVLVNPAQITSATGVEDYPSLSPDGSHVTYESNQSGNWDIWVSEVGGGSAANRTADNGGDDRYPSWSPDGRRIAFWSTRDGGGAFYLMSELGGAPERLSGVLYGGALNHSPAAWSPDGTQLAFVAYQPSGSRYDVSIQIVTIATRQARRLPLPGAQEGRIDLSWSHDGRHIAYLDIAQQIAETSRLMVLNVADGSTVPVSDASLNIRSPVWSRDDRALFFVCNLASTWDLWRQTLDQNMTPRGPKERITTGLDILHAAFSADGRHLVYAKGRWVSNVWRVPLGAPTVVGWGDAEQLTFDQAFIEFAQVSPDGQWLAFSSDRLGNQDLWKKRIGTDTLVRLTSDASLEWAPNWSPDGSQLAYYSNRTGNREIWIMSSDGGQQRQLTDTRTSLNAGGSWAPNGTEIAYRSERAGSSDLWVTSVDGSRSRVLAPSPAAEYAHAWSPDGKWIAFTSDRDGVRRLWRVRSDGGELERLTTSQVESPVWSVDGREIYYAGVGGSRLWALSLATRAERLVANLSGRRGHIGFQPPSTDGRFFYFKWRDDLGDIWVMDVR
jgi:Tol biopolymer transport system component